MLIVQHKLVQEDSTQGEPLAALQTLHWHLPAPLKDVLEQAIERFDDLRAPLVEEASNLHGAIAMRIRSPSGGHPLPIVPGAFGA
ncbi:MAG: hypothetical protein WAN46_12970 [Gammaproteobacteria bacterium]|jgi:hypothetical protein